MPGSAEINPSAPAASSVRVSRSSVMSASVHVRTWCREDRREEERILPRHATSHPFGRCPLVRTDTLRSDPTDDCEARSRRVMVGREVSPDRGGLGLRVVHADNHEGGPQVFANAKGRALGRLAGLSLLALTVSLSSAAAGAAARPLRDTKRGTTFPRGIRPGTPLMVGDAAAVQAWLHKQRHLGRPVAGARAVWAQPLSPAAAGLSGASQRLGPDNPAIALFRT